MDSTTLHILMTLAITLFAWGFREIQKRREERKVPAIVPVLAMAAPVAFFIWMIFFRQQALAVAHWQFVILGIVCLLNALLWFAGPPAMRSRKRAVIYLLLGAVLLALGFGLIAFGMAMTIFG